jgi:hypothetical protein
MKGSGNGKWGRGRLKVLQMPAKSLGVVEAEKPQSPPAEARGGGAKGVERC